MPIENPSRQTLIREAVENKEVLVSACGALATWTAPESTGRSPLDTLLVRSAPSSDKIDWNSPNNLPLEPKTFDLAWADALETLSKKKKIYRLDRTVGVDPAYALPVKITTPNALSALFCDTMFPAVAYDLNRSEFSGLGFEILALPTDKLDPKKYKGLLREDPLLGNTSTMMVALDFDRRRGLVYGSAYSGSIKKMLFTVMNYLLPQRGLLSMHAAANEGPSGETALLLGLSGTGKTTLSADPRRKLLGDDEHAWGEHGIFGLERGCYAKLVRLSPQKEPEIYRACFHEEPWATHGAIIENALMLPGGQFDLDDIRLTANARGSFPFSALSNIKEPPIGKHPKTILFLTADANGVLPPVSRLDHEQAMLWFLVGYTSKLEGTERGVKEPVAIFSRFFGSPFMPLKPDSYTNLLDQKLKAHGTQVYLINTGWTGGPYGAGRRLDIDATRAMVEAALSGALENVECRQDPRFHLQVPRSCPGISNPKILWPRDTWDDPAEYDRRAEKLTQEFCEHYEKTYASRLAF